MDHYTEAERRAAGRKLAKARATTAEATRIAKILAKSASEEGLADIKIAEQLGVDRATIRAWVRR